MASTRHRKSLYVIGTPESEILGAKLPSNKQVLSKFLYHHTVEKKTLRESSKTTFIAVKSFWEKAGIPTRASQHCQSKIENLYTKWFNLKKHRDRKTETQEEKLKAFVSDFDNLFDVAHQDALSTIRKEDRLFLQAQREPGRRGIIGSLDRVDLELKNRKRARDAADNKRKEKALKYEASTSTSAALDLSPKSSSSSASAAGSADTSEDESYLDAVGGAAKLSEESPRAGPSGLKTALPAKRPKNLLSPGLVSALDRTNISSRNAAYIMAETVRSMGENLQEYNINPSSIHRQRTRQRSSTASSLKASFTTDSSLTVHWDGKLMDSLDGQKKIERLPILVTGKGMVQLLGAPQKPHGTGPAQAVAVETCLKDWGLETKVQGLCFDTTASNTGVRGGACKLLEVRLGRHLLHFACRHHIHEVVLGGVCNALLGPSSGPDILLFKSFRITWPSIVQDDFKPASSDPDVEAVVAPVRENLIAFYVHHSTSTQPRDDYKELIELALIFLGHDVARKRDMLFRRPGAMNRARWMATLLYAIKIWLFRDQVPLTPKDQRAVRDIAVFGVVLYIKRWIVAPNATAAPRNDLDMMKELLAFKNKRLVGPAIKKLNGHLWYLSDELVALAFFDQEVSVDTKRAMVRRLEHQLGPRQVRPQLPPEAFDGGLDQFVTRRTLQFFDRLQIGKEFLTVDPTEWPNCEDYKAGLEVVEEQAVVNDFAERAVALVQSFNQKLTKKEDGLQDLLKVVQDHRLKYPDPKKKTLLKE